jgi:hypothetical protein
VVHPAFKDPGRQRMILFVDDSALLLGNHSAPNDLVEDDWWTLSHGGEGPLSSLPATNEEWDVTQQSLGVEGRRPPPVSKLKDFSTVVWATDLSNSQSTQSALFKAVAGGGYSVMQAYLSAGGTLIATGWHLAQDASARASLTDRIVAPNGICAAFAPGSREYQETVFPRMYLGIDNGVPGNQDGLRSRGFADFVDGYPTPYAVSLGFDTARVDTGNYSYGVQYPDQTGPSFKWNTNEVPLPINPDLLLFPGLAGVEGWILAGEFGCVPAGSLGLENPGQPVVQAIYTYHGVPMNVAMDGPPSPREGLVCGTFAQSHDLADHGGVYSPSTAVGRAAFFTFPLYFLKDHDAANIMIKSFEYVNASPTLP